MCSSATASAPARGTKQQQMSVTRTVYRQLCRLLRTAKADGIPVTGCVGLPHFTHVLCPADHIRSHFKHSHELDDAFEALRTLPKQLAVLQGCEEETRQALQQWSSLQQHWCQHSPLSVLQQLDAAEAGGWLLQRLVTQQAQQQMLCEGDVQELQQQSEAAIAAAHQRLDELAAAAQAVAPQAFPVASRDPPSAQQRLQQLEVLSQVLFKEAKLKNAPFEWVYDGLAPALLPQVLQRGKGMPLSLALVAAGVARRLGVRVQLLCAPEGLQSSTASGPLLLQQLPPEVAARQAGRTTASAPSPDNWLLQLLPPAGQTWGDYEPVFMDVSQNGKLLTAAACISRYPQLQGALASHPAHQQHQQQHQHQQQQQELGGSWAQRRLPGRCCL